MMMMMMLMVITMMAMLFQVNDSSMALLGGAHGDDYRHIVELVVNKMEVYCRKASLSTTTIRFLSLKPLPVFLCSVKPTYP